MTAATRIYVVFEKDKEDPKPRLVRATNPAQAIRHVVRETFAAVVPSQDDLFGLASQGVKVEVAKAEETEPQGATA